jgi:hypothetical protein
MNKDNIIGFLVELNEMLETEKFKIPNELFDDSTKTIKRNLILEWKSRVDESTADLSMRWLQEEVSLETCIKQWSSAFYADFEFTEAIGKIAKIVEDWKRALTEALYKDASVYTMPKESAENDSENPENPNDSLQEDSSSSEDSEDERKREAMKKLTMPDENEN